MTKEIWPSCLVGLKTNSKHASWWPCINVFINVMECHGPIHLQNAICHLSTFLTKVTTVYFLVVVIPIKVARINNFTMNENDRSQ